MKIEKRKWESWWDRKASPDFLKDRPRKIIFEKMAEILSEKGGEALDVGCGICLAYPHMLKAGLKYTGIDFTVKFLEYARGKHHNINVKHASALDLPYDDCEFETVFCQSLLEHIHPNDVHKAIEEMMRVSRKYVLISFFRPPWDKDTNLVETWDFVSITYSKKLIADIIENHPHFKRLEIENFMAWALYKIELAPCEP